MSFAPLAGRLAAHAAAIRPVDDARDDWAKVAALVMCLLLDLLICVCEALDARAATDTRPATAPARRGERQAPVPATRAGRQAVSGESCARSPGLSPVVQLAAPRRAATPSQAAEATPALWLAGLGDPAPRWAVLASSWRLPPQNAVFQPTPTHADFVTLT